MNLGGVGASGVREIVSEAVSVVRGYGYRRELDEDLLALDLRDRYIAPGESTVRYSVVGEDVPIVLVSINSIEAADWFGVSAYGVVQGDNIVVTFVNGGPGVEIPRIRVRVTGYVASEVFEVREFTGVSGGRELRLPPAAVEESRIETAVARMGDVLAQVQQDVRLVEFADAVGEFALGNRVRVRSGVEVVTGVRHRLLNGVLVSTLRLAGLSKELFALVGVVGRQEVGEVKVG